MSAWIKGETPALGNLLLPISTRPASRDWYLSILLILESGALEAGCWSINCEITQFRSRPVSSSPELYCQILLNNVLIKPDSSSFGAYTFMRDTSMPSIKPLTIIYLPSVSLCTSLCVKWICLSISMDTPFSPWPVWRVVYFIWPGPFQLFMFRVRSMGFL